MNVFERKPRLLHEPTPWGTRLALRISKSFAAEVGLHANAAVVLSLVEGTLVVRPIAPPCYPQNFVGADRM